MSTLLKTVVYGIFQEGGLWDMTAKFEREEQEALKAWMMTEKPFDMNMKAPEDCTNTTCAKVTEWVGPRGVSDDAANMRNFQVTNMSNITIQDVDVNLDQFESY